MTKIIQIPRQSGHVFNGQDLALIDNTMTLPYTESEAATLTAAGVQFTVSEPMRRSAPPIITKGFSDTDTE